MQSSRDRNLRTQTGLARRSGVAQSTIGRILREEVNPEADNLLRIAGALRVPLATLFGVEQVESLDTVEQAESLDAVQKRSVAIFAKTDSHVRPDGLMKRHLGYRVELIAIARAVGVDPEQLLGRLLRWSDTEGT